MGETKDVCNGGEMEVKVSKQGCKSEAPGGKIVGKKVDGRRYFPGN
jgi:hypothetical protein